MNKNTITEKFSKNEVKNPFIVFKIFYIKLQYFQILYLFLTPRIQ